MDPSRRRYRRSPDVVSRAIGQETVLLDLHSGRYFGLNVTGAAIWELIGPSGASLESVVEGVVARFAVEAFQALRDVNELIASLEEQKLIVRDD